jgi:hypothetical protein
MGDRLFRAVIEEPEVSLLKAQNEAIPFVGYRHRDNYEIGIRPETRLHALDWRLWSDPRRRGLYSAICLT